MLREPMRKVVHLTSVHTPLDTRIFHKECGTLARAGYDVVLVVPYDRNESVNGVRIRAVPPPRNRIGRMTRTAWRVYKEALSEDADVYHFHDPELIPAGFLLRMRGKPVIYDIHEDNVTAIRQKAYLPRPLRPLLANLLETVEKYLTKSFDIVLAERYYARRFSEGTTVLNYPVRKYLSTADLAEMPKAPRLLFTGKVARIRGALIHAQIVSYLEGVDVYIVGYCDQELAEEMRQRAGDQSDRLHLDGDGVYVPYQQILGYYSRGGWTAGLALFLPNPHDMEKELTKLFEYMGAGIPIICSDFPVWRALVEESGTGLCVDPQDPEAIAGAVQYLLAHPEEAQRMRQNGLRAVEKQYNWAAEAQKLLSLYERIISRSQRAGPD